MTLTEAVRSGQPFKRPHFISYVTQDEIPDFCFSREDLLEDDWYIEEEKVTITASQFDAAIKRIKMDEIWDYEHYTNAIKSELGL